MLILFLLAYVVMVISAIWLIVLKNEKWIWLPVVVFGFGVSLLLWVVFSTISTISGMLVGA